jgi:hypothetical protein
VSPTCQTFPQPSLQERPPVASPKIQPDRPRCPLSSPFFIQIRNFHQAPFAMSPHFLYSLYAYAKTEYLCISTDCGRILLVTIFSVWYRSAGVGNVRGMKGDFVVLENRRLGRHHVVPAGREPVRNRSSAGCARADIILLDYISGAERPGRTEEARTRRTKVTSERRYVAMLHP